MRRNSTTYSLYVVVSRRLMSARAASGRAGPRLLAARPSSPPRTPATSTLLARTAHRIVDYLAPSSPMDADEDLLLELLFKM
ncbi:hypothetical protein EVAR_50829_1 [Eumeta japonica]|uniref:Uncharacterized protein n=1 Tax=Eumeta variegata TaxID=151549 RepID=A0A4C1XGM0_EUMVA|nr:hypothetical protein EVAR_50829_1 [Eumeta japonica]